MASWTIWAGNRSNIASYSVITNDEDASYPFSNCFDEDILTVGKPADADDTIVRLDLGAAYSIDGVAVAGHTLGSQTATFTLKYSATDNSADAWGDLTTCAAFLPSADNPNSIRTLDPPASKRYWWFGITGQDAVVQIAEIHLFDLIRTIGRAPSLGLERSKTLGIARSETLGGYQRRTKYAGQKRRWRIPWNLLPRATDYAYIWTDLGDYTEWYRPFWITDEYYDADNYKPGYMVYVDQDDLRSRVDKCDRYDLDLTVVEA